MKPRTIFFIVLFVTFAFFAGRFFAKNLQHTTPLALNGLNERTTLNRFCFYTAQVPQLFPRPDAGPQVQSFAKQFNARWRGLLQTNIVDFHSRIVGGCKNEATGLQKEMNYRVTTPAHSRVASIVLTTSINGKREYQTETFDLESGEDYGLGSFFVDPNQLTAKLGLASTEKFYVTNDGITFILPDQADQLFRWAELKTATLKSESPLSPLIH